MNRKTLIATIITIFISVPTTAFVTTLVGSGEKVGKEIVRRWTLTELNRSSIIKDRIDRMRQDSLILCVVDRIDSTSRMNAANGEKVLNALSKLRKNQNLIIKNTDKLRPFAEYMGVMAGGNDSTANGCKGESYTVTE